MLVAASSNARNGLGIDGLYDCTNAPASSPGFAATYLDLRNPVD